MKEIYAIAVEETELQKGTCSRSIEVADLVICNGLIIKNRFGECDPASGTEAQVCKDIATRQEKGIQKYGVSVADNPLTAKQWIQHAYEEALDLAVYLKRLISIGKGAWIVTSVYKDDNNELHPVVELVYDLPECPPLGSKRDGVKGSLIHRSAEKISL
jgi:hypothetical protein